MIKKDDSPLATGVYVRRGFLRWSGVIAEIGQPHECPEGLLVPVKYTDGTYAVVVVTERMRRNGCQQFDWAELWPRESDCYEAIRYSKGMPEIVVVLSGCYKVGVTDGEKDQAVFVRRGKDSMVSEQVVIV